MRVAATRVLRVAAITVHTRATLQKSQLKALREGMAARRLS